MSGLHDESRASERSQMLVNRVKKNARHRRKQARRDGVTCLRLYDRDIPELPLVIDDYEGWLHASVFLNEDEDPARAEPLCLEWLRAAASALQLNPELVVLKVRSRQKGAQQYHRRDTREERLEIGEAGLKFWVNLHDYLDTGLFLDHRVTRELVSEEARGKRVLNLFAYTGSFTVHAAAGGALETTTVDSTSAYLTWAKDNLELNRLDGPQHRFIRADVRSFLDEERGEVVSGRRPPYDLIILDPPTFSNSKGSHADFDVRRHHAQLFNALAPITATGGVLYFSNNARRFSIESGLERAWEIEEITQRTTPFDFQQRRAHRCWRCIRRA